MKKWMILIIICTMLQGCFIVVGAALGATAVGAVVYDKRSPKISKLDKKITESIKAKINAIPNMDKSSHVVVATFEGVVLLAGQVPSADGKQQMTKIAQSIGGVKRVYNELVIKGTPSTLSKMSDSWINTKIRSNLISNENLKSSEILVVTENGVVYLMGSVTKKQARIAVKIAQHVSGVQKVVKIFTYQ